MGTATAAPASAAGCRAGRTVLRRWYQAVYGLSTRRLVLFAVVVPAVLIGAAAIDGRVTARGVLLALLLGTATVTDLLWRRIFNWPTLAALAWVAGLHAVTPGGAGWTGLPAAAESATGAVVCFVVMLGLYLMFRGGEGDVKLLAAIGALLGPNQGMEALILGYVLAAGLALVILAGRRVGLGAGPFQLRTLPMAPFFTAGVVLTLGLPA